MSTAPINPPLSSLILDDFEAQGSKCLLVISDGLGSFALLHDFVNRYAKFNSLTFVLNFTKLDSALFKANFYDPSRFEIVLHDFKSERASNRAKTYLRGGVIFTTSQILTTDVLSGVLSPHLINNIVVFRTDAYDSNSTEFLLRLIREKSVGSTNPERLLLVADRPNRVVDKCDKILKNCGADTALIWPYFRLDALRNLEEQERPVSVAEFKVDLSAEELGLQGCILNLIAILEKKLKKDFDYDPKRAHFFAETSDDTTLNTLANNYWQAERFLHLLCEAPLQTHLLAFWRLGSKLEQSVFNEFAQINEIEKFDRKLEERILLLSGVDNPRPVPPDVRRLMTKPPPETWELRDRLTMAFYSPKKTRAVFAAFDRIEADFKDAGINTANVMVLFSNSAKMGIFSQLLLAQFESPVLRRFLFFAKVREILEAPAVRHRSTHFGSSGSFNLLVEVLGLYLSHVLPNDLLLLKTEHNQDLINDILEERMTKIDTDDWEEDNVAIEKRMQAMEAEKAMQDDQDDELKSGEAEQAGPDKAPKETLKRLRKSCDEGDLAVLYSFLSSHANFLLDGEPIELLEPDFKNQVFLFPSKTRIEVSRWPNLVLRLHTFDYDKTVASKTAAVLACRPDAVVFYDLDTPFERELCRLDQVYPARLFGDAAQVHKPRQIINVIVKNSIQSQTFFDKILQENKAFESIAKKVAEIPRIFEAPSKGLSRSSKGIIIVDDREFGSRLPFELYQAGFYLQSVRLEIGDYILSDSVAVERKNARTGDLSGSIRNGRLERQLGAMLKAFNRTILLVEHYDAVDLQSTLELYKIVARQKGVVVMYSKDEAQSATIFELLRKNERDPDPAKFKKVIAEEGAVPKDKKTATQN